MQKLLEAVLKRCADLAPSQSSKRHAVSQKLLVGRTKQDRDDLPRTLCGCFIYVPSPHLNPPWFSAISFDPLASRWYQTLNEIKMDAGECYHSKSVKFCGAPLEHATPFMCPVLQSNLNFPFFPTPTL